MRISGVIFLSFIYVIDVQASGALMKRKQAMENQAAQQQQQIIEQQQQQLLQQRQETYRQRGIEQQQAARQRQQEENRQQVIQQRRAEAQQRASVQRQQAKRKVQTAAQQQEQAEVQQHIQVQQQISSQRKAVQFNQSFDIQKQADTAEVKEIVYLEDIWKVLEVSSEVWNLMIDQTPKVASVDRYIEWYRQRGTVIQNPPIYYVRMIDAMSKENPGLLKNPFEEVLKFVAIIEYDFDNGRDKDLMAIETLGEEVYRKNKKRMGK